MSIPKYSDIMDVVVTEVCPLCGEAFKADEFVVANEQFLYLGQRICNACSKKLQLPQPANTETDTVN